MTGSPEAARPSGARFPGARVLVTGAGGFIGSHLVRALVAEGASVSALGRSPAPGGRLAGLDGQVGAWRGDLEDAGELRRIVLAIEPEYVFHLGAVVDLERNRAVADACVRVNALGTLNLLQALDGLRVRALVLASTTEVYGDNPTPFGEDQREHPRSPYAVSKLAAEHLCLFFHRVFGCPASVLRLSTVYGPDQSARRLIPSVIEACLRRQRLAMGDPDQSRDFVHVGDAVEGLVRAALGPAAVGEIINLGHERPRTIREIVDTIHRLAGPCPAPLWGQLPRRIDEPLTRASRADKARRLLGWEAATDLEAGLTVTLASHRAASTAPVPRPSVLG